MLVPLHAERRRTLLRFALCTLVGALLIAPLASPLAVPADPQSRRLPPLATSFDATPAPEQSPLVERDPFVPEVAATVEAGAPASIVVEAVAFGASPQALVREGASTRIVRAGDQLDGSTIASIDARGIVLESGDRLDLTVPR